MFIMDLYSRQACSCISHILAVPSEHPHECMWKDEFVYKASRGLHYSAKDRLSVQRMALLTETNMSHLHLPLTRCQPSRGVMSLGSLMLTR